MIPSITLLTYLRYLTYLTQDRMEWNEVPLGKAGGNSVDDLPYLKVGKVGTRLWLTTSSDLMLAKIFRNTTQNEGESEQGSFGAISHALASTQDRKATLL